jgi:protein O-mannosyl-transferase
MDDKLESTISRQPGPALKVAPPRFNAFLAGRWPLAILLLLAALPYVGVLRNDFAYMYDDKPLILDSAYVHSTQHLREILTSTLFSNQGSPGGPPYYRPVAKLGFLLCYQLFGPSASGFHLVSLLLNVAVVGAVFLFAAELSGDRVAALATAGIFALHPAHVEAVAWIASVTDIEVTLFYVLTFWCFLRAAAPEGGRRGWAVAGMTASFALALLSKEQAVTLPVLATIYEFFLRGDRKTTSPLQKILRVGPLWLLCVLYILLRVQLMGSFEHVKTMNAMSLPQVLLSALALTGQYLGVLLWPVHLSSFHLFHASQSLFAPAVLAGILALGICAVLFIRLWKNAPQASLGILWLLITLAPVLNARWMSAYVLCERYLYLPSVGFCLVAGWACAQLWKTAADRGNSGRMILIGAACVVAALCALRISLRVLDWYDDITLFRQALVDVPGDYRLHDALGAAYAIRGQRDLAEQEWKESLRLDPKSLEPLTSLGSLYAQEGRFNQAMPLLENALQMNPDSADIHLNLGAAYAETGRMDLAEQHFRAAVAISPINFNSHNVLGKLYLDSHRLPEAEEQFRQSLQSEPNLAAYDHLGYIYMQRGESAQAEQAFKAALLLNKMDSHAHYNLGLIDAAAGRNSDAIEELQSALAADPNNADILGELQKLQQGQASPKPH